ncbi:hypothetical protein GBAR_LOCUS13754, partial [Geodia barretti]
MGSHPLTLTGLQCMMLECLLANLRYRKHRATAQPGAYFGEGVNKPVHLISIQCSGSEIELVTECESEEEGSTDQLMDGGQDCVGV